MHPDMIWGNDEKYTKEFQAKCREQQQQKYNELMEALAKKEKERERQEKIQEAIAQKERQAALDQGKIHNVFIRQYLEAKITAARWCLALSIVATALFKGQWLLWISFIITYFLYVNKIKADAIKADKRRKELGKKK